MSDALGDWIAFLDSDDVLLPNYFSTILSVIRNYDADIIQFKFLRFFEDISKIIPYHLYLSKQGEYKLDNDLLCEIFNDNAWYAWSRIYKAELFRETSFPVGYNFEDAATIPYLMLKSKSVVNALISNMVTGCTSGTNYPFPTASVPVTTPWLVLQMMLAQLPRSYTSP